MATPKIYLALILGLFLIADFASAQSCKDEVLSVGGRTFNIKELKELEKINFKSGSFEYSFGVCKKVTGECGYFDCYRTKEYTGCQYENQFVDYCLGLSGESDIFELITVDGASGFAITSKGGDQYLDGCWKDKEEKRAMRVEVLCDSSKTGMPTDIQLVEPVCTPEVTYTYTFRFYHAAACSGKGGLSAGSIMLIIFFVCLALYLIVGIIVNILVRQKSGIEIIPNWSFWSDVPSLIKEGFGFIIGKIRGTGGGYTTVE